MRAPVAADFTWAKSLTMLTSASIRCIELLAPTSHDWLTTDKDPTITHRRRMILAAGGHAELIPHFANFLEKHPGVAMSEAPQLWRRSTCAHRRLQTGHAR